MRKDQHKQRPDPRQWAIFGGLIGAVPMGIEAVVRAIDLASTASSVEGITLVAPNPLLALGIPLGAVVMAALALVRSR